MCETCQRGAGPGAGIPRRDVLRATGPAGLVMAGAAGTAGNLPLLTGTAEAADRGRRHQSKVTLRWFGNSAWEIRSGKHRVLIDPYLSRFEVGMASGNFNPQTPLQVKKKVIDSHIGAADLILCSHGHWDHMNDVPYIAERTGAPVMGTESHMNLLAAMGLPAKQQGHVSGGEHIDFDGFTVEVLPSLHSVSGAGRYAFPGTLAGFPPGTPVKEPTVIADLVEGGTLGFQITVTGGPKIFVMPNANFIEREITGLRPDVAILAVGPGPVHRYFERYMNALGKPRLVLPTHWDSLETPVDEPAVDLGELKPFIRNIRTASPRTRVAVPEHLEPIEL